MPKIQLGEPVSFTGVTYRNMGEGLLTGAEVTQRQLPQQTKATQAWVTTHNSWKPGHTSQVPGSLVGWKVSFPSGPVGLSLSGFCFF